MPENTTISIKVDYKDSPTKVSFAPSGIWGGNNFQGQIIAHFFTESRAFPVATTVTMDSAANKVVESVENRAGELRTIREVQASIVLSPDIAEAIGNWLIGNATILREQMRTIQSLKSAEQTQPKVH
jgi:hypothetical protein